MKARHLRNLQVSEIGVGCMGFSHGYGAVPDEQYATDAIRTAFDFGCTFFDTAEGYGKEMFWAGHNEQLVGKAVEPFRKDIVLATKLHVGTEELNGKTLYEVIKLHLLKSMENLRTDYIDLYYLHRVNENIPVEDVAEVMGRLIGEGLIRAWGLSQVDVSTLDRAHKVTPVSAVQNLYNIMERDCEEDIFPYCLENDIGVVPFSPVASGFLSGKVTDKTKFEGDDVRKFVPQLFKENLQANAPILNVVKELAQNKGVTPAQISIAWMLYKYPNVVPIPGSKNKERILENLGASNVIFSDDEFKEFESKLAACTIHGHRGHVETEQHPVWQSLKKK